MMKPSFIFLSLVYATFLAGLSPIHASDNDTSLLRVARFEVDATPPIGSPLAYGAARSVDDKLSARGIILLGGDKPIVLCAVDWIGIGNGGQDEWKDALATAAHTDANRVCVHTLHQHDAPDCDFAASKLLHEHGVEDYRYNPEFSREIIRRVSKAIELAIPTAASITHIGVGQARVEKVASNRRILGDDGKVKIVRFSSTKSKEAIAAPEGTIDPYVRVLGFYDHDQPIVYLTYYACHPQSYYGKGDISCDFVGIARNQRQNETDIPHVHFNGAGGNVAAGKYNDGSPELRPILAERLAKGMERAVEDVKKQSITAEDLSWNFVEVTLPPSPLLNAKSLQATLENSEAPKSERASAARKLSYLSRVEHGPQTQISCLSLANHRILHFPGELFVEYQLAASKMWSHGTVFFAAYQDYGPGYIGTAISYDEGGYETSLRASSVAPSVEDVLSQATHDLLRSPSTP